MIFRKRYIHTDITPELYKKIMTYSGYIEKKGARHTGLKDALKNMIKLLESKEITVKIETIIKLSDSVEDIK